MRLLMDNTNVCSLYSLRNTLDDAVVADADVELTIHDSSGTPVGGGIWPQVMRHISDGHYRVTLEHRLILSRGRNYYGTVTATDTEGRQGQWERQLVAEPQKVC